MSPSSASVLALASNLLLGPAHHSRDSPICSILLEHLSANRTLDHAFLLLNEAKLNIRRHKVARYRVQLVDALIEHPRKPFMLLLIKLLFFLLDQGDRLAVYKYALLAQYLLAS